MSVAFELPVGSEAAEPPLVRDGVRLLVAHGGGVEHTTFSRIGDFLSPGDLVVINTSATLAAAVDGVRADWSLVTVHFSTVLDDGDWVVEVRPRENAAGPVTTMRAGEVVVLPDGVRATLVAPYPGGQHRLWRASVGVEGDVAAYLNGVGRPIRYAYVLRQHPLREYQTVFAREPGSAEMPSAGRPFSDAVLTDLATRGIGLAPVVLHTGVSSQTAGEPPQPERFRVSAATARQVNMTRAWGGRVVAVGTTVTRALETAADDDGVVRECRGWTDLVLGPQQPAAVVSGLVTGWHEPGASHLKLLEAVAGADLVGRAYEAAVARRYLWHEFGDSCLLLP